MKSLIINEIRKIAKKNPESVYSAPDGQRDPTACLYVHWGEDGPKPGCIVGHATRNLGFSFDALSKYEGEPSTILITNLGLDLSKEQFEWIREVQFAQDIGAPWGRAVEHADSLHGKVR